MMQAKVRDYEKQIDQLVYKLYGLTPEEIKIVDDYNSLPQECEEAVARIRRDSI